MRTREIERILRYFWRSGSLRFALSSRDSLPIELTTFDWNGRKVYYRTGTREPEMVYNILVRGREYSMPRELNPATVVDIGANVGLTSVYMSALWPEAKIFSCEPFSTNYEVLLKNAEGKSINTFNVGLGPADESRVLYQYPDGERSTNFGELTMYEQPGVEPEATYTINVRKADDFLAEQGITKIDVMKIDTEGAEYDIITTIPEAIVKDVKWIIGELHENRDFELLSYLSRWFDIKYIKPVFRGTSMFSACNKKERRLIP